MATGSGKSACFQLPPLIKDQAVLVISPSISLMKDQVPISPMAHKTYSCLNAVNKRAQAVAATAGEHAEQQVGPTRTERLPSGMLPWICIRQFYAIGVPHEAVRRRHRVGASVWRCTVTDVVSLLYTCSECHMLCWFGASGSLWPAHHGGSVDLSVTEKTLCCRQPSAAAASLST